MLTGFVAVFTSAAIGRYFRSGRFLCLSACFFSAVTVFEAKKTIRVHFANKLRFIAKNVATTSHITSRHSSGSHVAEFIFTCVCVLTSVCMCADIAYTRVMATVAHSIFKYLCFFFVFLNLPNTTMKIDHSCIRLHAVTDLQSQLFF